MAECELCPRMCGAKRDIGQVGYCGQTEKMKIARIALHPFEEPPISGKNGSGTVFFCGCSLGCVFCQNREISRGGSAGREYSESELAEEMLRLSESGAANINLVTASHFTPWVVNALRRAKPYLNIPVVWNSSGYERAETIDMLDTLVDIYLPDIKYFSPVLSKQYSAAPDYFEVAIKAIERMYRQVGKYQYAPDGTLKRGVVVRHLVLPACRSDSLDVLCRLAKAVPPSEVLISLMSQYTPDFALDTPYKNLHRHLTSFEYQSVLTFASELGFDGFSQSRASAVKDYTPDFLT